MRVPGGLALPFAEADGGFAQEAGMPIDESLQRDVEAEVKTLSAQRDGERREKVAAAGGELLGAALNLVGQLLDTGSQPNAETVMLCRIWS